MVESTVKRGTQLVPYKPDSIVLPPVLHVMVGNVQCTSKIAMQQLMMKTLSNSRIETTDLQAFGPVDFEVLRFIIKRKYKIQISVTDSSKLLDTLNKLDEDQRSEKRSEENNKLMFKRAIKFLISRYKKTRWSEMKELKKR